MLYLLIAAAAIFFIMHVVLLFTSFRNAQLAKRRYFYSHLTLWITGGAVFLMALLYSGDGESGFLDYFNTAYKRALIIVFTLALSLAAHLLVRFVALPLMAKRA
ncbi:hypothetical protein FPZ43_12880 [Mucilaginibacter pallidiroseus]|uniref:Uncharacterized protein n=1 Tax=Mucilaginibacter pallidiroseus TaxID=2599295 RepID=A0A563U7S3_9SPHI|nr:hypothetical protein [Mucilaginibacter pallidiroseus]TWR27373.1 hypothetical protein FPZ43_12880 [Mucilaginibacter pallidiroseus]